MFSMISGLRLLNKLSFRSALTTSAFTQKYFESQTTFLLHTLRTKFLGYAVSSSIKSYNSCNYTRYHITRRPYNSQIDTNKSERELSPVEFEKISGETLDSLTEYFDELVDQAAHLQDADVTYGDGVLTVKFGEEFGTYVINRQTPNKQIWLSSPKSGPKRYDFIDGRWIYKHDGKSLHEILDEEIPTVVKSETTFDKCSYGRRKHTIG